MKNQEALWDLEYKTKKNLWSKETHQLPITLKGKKVLEIGVGNGKTLLSILKQKPKEVVCIDFSKEAVKLCKKEFNNAKNLTFFRADVTNLPFDLNSFDVIICYYVLNNLIEKERIKAISEINRVLNKKGLLLFEDFAFGDFRQDSEKKEIELNTIQKENGIISHFFTEKEIKTLFSIFSSVKYKNIIFNPIKGKNLKRKIISLIAKK